MAELDEAVREFLVESYENLDRLDVEMVKLEENPFDKPTLASIFRTIHTIKGTCGFFGYSKLESVAHVGENLLARLRDGKLALNVPIANAVLSMFDAVRRMLAEVEQSGADGDGDYSELVRTLTELVECESAASAAPKAPPAPVELAPTAAADSSARSTAGTASAEFETAASQLPDAPPPSVDRMGELLVAQGRATTEAVHDALAQQVAGDPRALGEILVEHGAVQGADVVEVLNAQQGQARAGVADASIRVDVALLDRLMNLVGELVLARNQLLQERRSVAEAGRALTLQRLNLVTTELQEQVMKTRMQPIRSVWSRFPRVVRDVSQACGKEVELELEGQDTELDKSILEAIRDPLTHIVRNSIDHGIELPEVRRAAGKPPGGKLTMRAFHEGGQVHIEIEDDGAGIRTEKVRDKAIERGLITAERARTMSERELVALIFLPGFSTAAKVTNVSGRGVGMDVVKTNIEKVGGTVEVESQAGRGTCLSISIPLTLAIVPALVVRASGERFAIPQVNLLELVRLEGEEIEKRIESVQGAPLYRRRGSLLPLIDLSRTLDLEAPASLPAVLQIVVVQAEGCVFGLRVDGIENTEEIVVKPLQRELERLGAFAGATIMGDGRVALILDVARLARRAEVRASAPVTNTAAASTNTAAAQQRATLLLVSLGHKRCVAVRLDQVARLEQIPAASVERAASGEVVQYRASLLPVLRLGALLGIESDTRGAEGELLEALVWTRGASTIGLFVERVMDIVDASYSVALRASASGVIGSTVIDGRVVDLVDLDRLIATHAPQFLEEEAASAV